MQRFHYRFHRRSLIFAAGERSIGRYKVLSESLVKNAVRRLRIGGDKTSYSNVSVLLLNRRRAAAHAQLNQTRRKIRIF